MRDAASKTIFFLTVVGVVCLMAAGGAQAPNTGLPWVANFETGDFSEFNGGLRNGTGATVETAGCLSGRCARVPLIAGTTSDTYGDFHFGDHAAVRHTKVEEVWLRFYNKFESGVQWPNRSHKMAILNLTDGVTWTRYYQVFVYVAPNGEYSITNSFLANWRFFGLVQNVGTPARVQFDRWEKFKLYVRLNTPGVANGIVRLWINDQLKAEHTTVNIRESTNYGVNKLNLSTYATDTSPNNGVQWFDSFIVSTTDPDAGQATPPNAPTNVRVVRN